MYPLSLLQPLTSAQQAVFFISGKHMYSPFCGHLPQLFFNQEWFVFITDDSVMIGGQLLIDGSDGYILSQT